MTELDGKKMARDKIKIYAYQADEMKAIWLQYHEPDVDEFQVSPGDVK
ncbi:MAG: hypothetical protein ACRD4Z_00570 [Nitrososphaeraceae archaeon]